jgi:hypothetical protein
MRAIKTEAAVAMSPWALGDGLSRVIWTGLTRRIGFAFGLVLGIALLGGLAFSTRTDVTILWYDERGHLAIGMKRTETEEHLAQVLRELAHSANLLETERAQIRVRERQLAADVRRHDLTEGILREAQRDLLRARQEIADQAESINFFKQENVAFRKQLEERGTASADPAIKKLEPVATNKCREKPHMNEYHVARVHSEAVLPLRDRPERLSRTLKAIPPSATGLLSTCKLAVYEDAVFVEVTYQGVTGWVSGYYLTIPQ